MFVRGFRDIRPTAELHQHSIVSFGGIGPYFQGRLFFLEPGGWGTQAIPLLHSRLSSTSRNSKTALEERRLLEEWTRLTQI